MTTRAGQVLGERITSGSGAGTHDYLHDGLDWVVALTNSSESIVNNHAYAPFSNATGVSEQVPNPFRYSGALYDPSTGLSKMGERYYDPSIGRFTQPDPLGGGYIYAGDDPVNYSDPSGLFPRKRKPAEHTNEARPSTKEEHEEGERVKKMSDRGEGADTPERGRVIERNGKLYTPWGKVIGYVTKRGRWVYYSTGVAVGVGGAIWLGLKLLSPACGPLAPLCLAGL